MPLVVNEYCALDSSVKSLSISVLRSLNVTAWKVLSDA